MSIPRHDTKPIAEAFRRAQGLPNPAGILIVDDHDLVRLGLRALIGSQTQRGTKPIQVFEVQTLATAIEVYRTNQASIGLVLLDLELSDSSGLQGLATFKILYPLAKVVVLSGESDERTVQKAVALGATAYLRKTADLSEVISHIRLYGLFNNPPGNPPATQDEQISALQAGGLRPRHSQILALLLQGRSNAEIGQLTCLAEGTVKNHVSAILLHFGVRSRSQLISTLR
jgi:DNA-binding NarL/FixJ family response regulator